MKIILTISLVLIRVFLASGQNISKDSSQNKKRNFEILSKGFNVGYRAGITSKNNELITGYYFDIVDIRRHRLITFDNDIWTNFNRIGFNSTVSYSGDLIALSFSTDLFQSTNRLAVVPALGLGFGYNDLFSLGIFYNHKFHSETDYPTLAFKLIVRPSFIKVIASNPDGSNW
jgi:hypothetical protein